MVSLSTEGADVAKQKKKLLYFVDHDDQESKDLKYGEQKDACKKRAKKPVSYTDTSISGDWRVEED